MTSYNIDAVIAQITAETWVAFLLFLWGFTHWKRVFLGWRKVIHNDIG
jgi:hypothetical protein